MRSRSRDLGLVAARRDLDLVALGLEIVAEQQRQRLLVLHDQDEWLRHVLVLPPD